MSHRNSKATSPPPATMTGLRRSSNVEERPSQPIRCPLSTQNPQVEHHHRRVADLPNQRILQSVGNNGNQQEAYRLDDRLPHSPRLPHDQAYRDTDEDVQDIMGRPGPGTILNMLQKNSPCRAKGWEDIHCFIDPNIVEIEHDAIIDISHRAQSSHDREMAARRHRDAMFLRAAILISLQHRPYRTVTPSATTNRKRAAAACAPSNQTAPQPERNSLRNSSGPTAVFYVPAIQPMPTRSGRMAATVASASIHQYYADFEAGYQIPFHELEEDEVLPIVKLHWTELEDSMAITNFRKAGTSGNNFPGAKICI
ncbi:unnamed protein product [Caenorhabditis angaria]|uniref:Uncharacterized protein n=1 Tax=Caenorhabditis angaria TaxID=860376 RepID=A0A9P1N9N8_9PELO|nr:unnamed protein product [Caenorhabditis angaria]